MWFLIRSEDPSSSQTLMLLFLLESALSNISAEGLALHLSAWLSGTGFLRTRLAARRCMLECLIIL